jgi:hypothetical protein
MTIFYRLRFETPPTWRARSLYLHPPGTGWSSYIPRHWVPFSSPLTTRRVTAEVFDPASTLLHWAAPIVSLCTDRIENTVSNSNSIVTCVFTTAITCLPIRCLETGGITPVFICLSSGRCIAMAELTTVCFNLLSRDPQYLRKNNIEYIISIFLQLYQNKI